MKAYKFLMSVFFALFLCSCSKENAPVSSEGSNDVFIGGIGTTRTYEETIRRFSPDSEAPYFRVPDSLSKRVSLNALQLQSGICQIINTTETVTKIDDENYAALQSPGAKEEYRMTSCRGTWYQLQDELTALSARKAYSPASYRKDEFPFRITGDAAMIAMPAHFENNFPSVPYIKNHLSVGDSWIRDKFVDSSGSTVSETIAKVTGIERVNIEAGTFNAYKIQLTTNHYRGGYSFSPGTEYFAPNVGLILKESDMDLYQWDSATGVTIHFREIARKELQSYSFVP